MNFNPLPDRAAGPPDQTFAGGSIRRLRGSLTVRFLDQSCHPQPMALLGIAGDCAFLRSASGQTGLVKEGDSLDDIKLFPHRHQPGLGRAGRAAKRILTIFSGYESSESLLSKETTHENTPQ